MGSVTFTSFMQISYELFSFSTLLQDCFPTLHTQEPSLSALQAASLTADHPKQPPTSPMAAHLCLESSLLEQMCLIGNLGKRRKEASFNPFQAATGARKGCLYLCMGYCVPNFKCYCNCIAKWTGVTAGLNHWRQKNFSVGWWGWYGNTVFSPTTPIVLKNLSK